MRYPGENGAGQPSGRRRGASEPDAQPRRRHGVSSGQPHDSGQPRDSALFSPGYRDPQQHGATSDAEPGRYGRAGATAGKGPLRGFPPAPGQPPPLYPPGQFSAWNTAGMPGRGGEQQGGGPAGADAGYQDAGYPALAVSDPAADVTSTQTWGAVSDGRETGTWTYPAGTWPAGGGPAGSGPAGSGPAGGRARHGKPGRPADPAGPAGRAGQRAADPAAARQASAGTNLAAADTAAGQERAAGSAVRPPADPVAGAPATRQDSPAAAGKGSPGPAKRGPAGRQAAASGRAASRQASRDQAGRVRVSGDQAAAAAAGTQAPAAVSSKRSGKASRARKRSRRGPVLVSIALILVLGALTYYLVKHHQQASSARPPAAQTPAAVVPAASPAPTSPSASATPPQGRWRYISARSSDPLPLTLSELFPARFTAGAAYTRSAGLVGKKCAAGVVGQRLQHAVADAGCSQVLRASYLSAGKKQMGTIGVLNLRTATAAAKAGKNTGPAQFIRPLNAKRGPASKLSKAAGLEEAEVKGHYLILVFADGTGGQAPKGKAQRQALVMFMNQLIRHTVNVSLTSRMVAGKP